MADAIAYASRRLGGRTPDAYFATDVDAGAVLATQDDGNLVLLVDRALQAEASVLRFLCGRVIESARDEHVLLVTLPDDTGASLVAAVGSAFGPHAGAPDGDRDQAALVSALWNTLPKRAQQEISGLIEATTIPIDYATVRATLDSATARAGLAVCGDLRAAAEGLLRSDPHLRSADVREEAGFIAACQCSAAFADIIRTALSDPFLAARVIDVHNMPAPASV